MKFTQTECGVKILNKHSGQIVEENLNEPERRQFLKEVVFSETIFSLGITL